MMGGGGVPRGGRPSQVAYYIALAGICSLILLLCCYFCYFFIKKFKELYEQESPSTTPASSCRPARAAPVYPVQPVVRESATAMARLCSQLPASAAVGAGKGVVFPASTSPPPLSVATPASRPTHADDEADTAPPPPPDGRDKLVPPGTAPEHIETVK